MTDKKREPMDFSMEEQKKPAKSGDRIKAEVEKLAKKGPLTHADYADLYNKYGDEEAIVDEILRLRTKRYNRIKKYARKAAEKIYEKFNRGDRPFHEILDRMMKYKTEHKWTDYEYDEFRKELSNLLMGSKALEIDYNQNLAAYRSRINRTLGNNRIQVTDGLKISESEHGILSEILSMFERSLATHKSVFMHSLIYTDLSLVAMTGEFKREKHIAVNHIHPLLACIYLPKLDYFEKHTLYSNFGSIVKCCYEKKPIMTEPDSLLFYDITSDPNDVVCETKSPITDIRNRYRVQIKLWETVLQLRNGNYYEAEAISSFLESLNACRNNLYDNADLAYTQDEGAMLRRFMSVFSLRPTIVKTAPIQSIASFAAGPYGMGMGMGLSGNGFGHGLLPFNNQPVYTVTSIPMITLQIPSFTEESEPKDLRSAITQTLWINENKTIIPKEQSIIYSKEVLIFYVNRRIQRINIRTYANPLTFSQLPLTMSSFEKLNGYTVNVPPRITLGRAEETYNLRSVVAVTETEIKQGENTSEIITGCVGLLMKHRDFETYEYDDQYYIYDPLGASIPVAHPDGKGWITNKPISRVEPYFHQPAYMTGNVVNASFFNRAGKTGTIFIYAKPGGYDTKEIISI